MDSKKIQEELDKSRHDYDELKRKKLPAELEVTRANDRVNEAKKTLQRLEAEAEKRVAEQTEIREGMTKYHTEVESLERQLKVELEQIKKGA